MRADSRRVHRRMWLLTRTCVLVTGVALMAFFTFAPAAGAVLQAGAAKITITPPECSVGGSCPGYSLAAGNGRISTGVHDDIWARALVMTSGNDSVILVVLDVLGHLPDRIRGMQAALRAAYPAYVQVLVHDDGETDPVVRRYVDGSEVIENVLIANAHTHASPDCIGVYGPDSYTTGRNPVWMDYVDNRVVEVVGMAIANLQPAKMRANNYHVPDYLGFPLITDRREPIVVDHTMGVMQLANTGTDEVICTLVNYSGYPEMMGILENTKMTADFPGVMDQSLEAYFGGISIWVTRVIGGFTVSYYDVNANGLEDDDGYAPNNHLRTFPGMTAYGELMADVAKEALTGVPYEGSPDLTLKTSMVNLPMENPLYRLLLGEANYVITGLIGDLWTFLAEVIGLSTVFEPTPSMMLDHEGQGALGAPRKIEMPITVFALGSAMFTTTPSQLFAELWLGTSPAELLANPAWDFNPSQSGNPNYEYHPRMPGLTGIRDFITVDNAFNLGSTYAEMGYLLPSYEYDHSMKTYQDFVDYIVGTHDLRYEEGFSVGRDAGDIVQRELIRLISEFNAGLVN